MMKTGSLFLFFLLIFSSVVFFSCKKDKAGGGSKSSSYNDNSSHNVGTACMNCHNSGGSNQYWWAVAGTVFKPDSTSLNPNSTIYLFSGPNGTGNLKLTLPVDGKGNFYTSSSVSFGSGLYPEVKSSSGEIRYMQSSITNGNCNSCHNSSRRIMVN
jgi:hypothetical protein